MTASDASGNVLFKQERDYRNIGLSRSGEPATAAWSISSYSNERSTAFRPNETKREMFPIPVPPANREILITAKLFSYHGLPVVFGRPAAGEVMLEVSQRAVLQ